MVPFSGTEGLIKLEHEILRPEGWQRLCLTGGGGTKAELSLNVSGHLASQRGLSKRRDQVQSRRVIWPNQSVTADNLSLSRYCRHLSYNHTVGTVTLSLLSERAGHGEVPVT